MSYRELSERRWIVEDRSFVPVTIVAAGNVYIRQTNTDTGTTDEIMLTRGGAQSLSDALAEALSQAPR